MNKVKFYVLWYHSHFGLQKIFVDSTSEFMGLVQMVVVFIDPLLGCHKTHCLGEHLLKTLDKLLQLLLPKLKKDYCLGLFERIAENEKLSPSALLNLLFRFMAFLLEKHNGLRSWHYVIKILGICRQTTVRNQRTAS